MSTSWPRTGPAEEGLKDGETVQERRGVRTTHTTDSQTACAAVREWEHSASVCAGCSHCVSVAPLVGLLPLLLSVVPLGLHHRTCANIPVTNTTTTSTLTLHTTPVCCPQLPKHSLHSQTLTHSQSTGSPPCLINTTPVQISQDTCIRHSPDES